jgi:hypothetical protein
MEKMAQIRQISQKKGFEIDRFYDKFQEVAKNIERF